MPAQTKLFPAHIEQLARAICLGCDENPNHPGDCAGNLYRWHDYISVAVSAIKALSDGGMLLRVKQNLPEDEKSCQEILLQDIVLPERFSDPGLDFEILSPELDSDNLDFVLRS